MSPSVKSRILTTLTVAAILAIGVSAPAYASQTYTGALSANSSAPGGSVQYSSDNTGEPDGTPGTYSLSPGTSSALGGPVINLAASVSHSVAVSAHSHLAFTFRLPANAKAGSTYTLSVRAGKFSDSQTIKIVGVPASVAGANLTWLWIAIAVVILIALILILAVARRRRSTVTAA